MRILLFLSDLMIPLLFFYIIGFGLLMKKDIYNDFVTGAFDGLKTVVKIMPTLIGLMTGVGILRASGFLDALASLLENLLKPTGFPSALVPLSIVKMFSSSAATSLLLDLYKQHGPDSTIGLTASLILSSTETIFYTLSVYYIAAKVQNPRYTLPGALKGDAHRLTGYPLAALVLVVVASRLDLVHGMQQAARYHGLRHFERDAHYSSTSHVIEFRSRPVTMRGLSA